MASEIANVKTFFANIQIHFSDIWLESCVNWCKRETLASNYSAKDLQSKVYEQWLLLDLRDIEVPALPPNLSTKQNYTLNGNFCLQLMQVMDISKPKLWQLQKIRNNNALTRGTQQDADVAGTGKRMLQMTLTDGVQEVETMEYRPVPCLSLNLPPGCKIRIMGPIAVRRGRLMLEQQNVKVLGGEVEELLVPNAAENVLARLLKLPENPNPVPIEEKLLVVEREEKNEGFVSNLKVAKPQPMPATKSVKVAKPEPAPAAKNIKNNRNITDEEMLMDEEIDLLMEAEAEFNNCQGRQLNKSRTPDLFENVDFDANDFDNINRSSTTRRPQNLSHSLDEDDDVFNDIDIDAHLDKIEKQSPKPNIVTIAKLLENKNNINRGTFKIKAKFKGVVEKLTITDEYKLVIKVEDSTGELIVRVHSDVISDFAGCTPATIINLKSNVLGKDEAAVEKMMQAIMKVKNRLLEIDNVMSVQVEKNEIPVITKIL